MDVGNRVWIETHPLCEQALKDKCWDILDVGSFIVKGQESIQCRTTIGDKCKSYTGLDMRQGDGVDIVSDAGQMPLENDKYHLVICLDMLEHAAWPRDVIREIFRVTKPGGYLFLATVFNFPIHDYPSDYWRFTPNCMKLLLEDAGFEVVDYHGCHDELQPGIVRGLGRKPCVS